MRKITYLILAGTLLATSCKKKNDDPTPTTPTVQTAKVQFTNACINSNTLGIKINDTTLTAVTGLNFLQSSSYVGVNQGSSTKVTFVYPNTGTTFQETTMSLSNNNFYSVFLGGEVPGNIALVTTTDDLTAPTSGKAKVRFVNLSADDYNISFYVGGPKLDSNVGYKGYTPFREVTAGSVNIIAQDPMQVGYQRTLNGQTFAAGKIYTVIMSGKNGAAGDADLKLTLVNNN